jgi:microcystin-dependent protein
MKRSLKNFITWQYFLWRKYWGHYPISGGALGDGDAWDETTPNNATLLSDGDDHIRDLRKGIRIRMEYEHATFAGSSVGGKHKFITLQTQAVKPSLSGSQIGAVYAKDVAGTKELFYEDSAGTEIQLTSGGIINSPAAPTVPTGVVLMFGGTIASIPTGYLGCDGSAVSRVTYAALFAVIGVTHGSGDGVTTFNLPDFKDRFPFGAATGGVGVPGNKGPTSNAPFTLLGSGNDMYQEVKASTAGATEGTTNPNASSKNHVHNYMPRYTSVPFIIKT